MNNLNFTWQHYLRKHLLLECAWLSEGMLGIGDFNCILEIGTLGLINTPPPLLCLDWRTLEPINPPPSTHTHTYLDDWVSTLQQCNGQQNALLEDPVTGSIHNKINDQIRSPFFVQMALDLCQIQLPSASNTRADNCVSSKVLSTL